MFWLSIKFLVPFYSWQYLFTDNLSYFVPRQDRKITTLPSAELEGLKFLLSMNRKRITVLKEADKNNFECLVAKFNRFS